MGNTLESTIYDFTDFVERTQENLVFKSINFCPVCFKDDEGISFREYGKDKINQKREEESLKKICDYLKQVKKDFFEKIKTYEIDNFYDFLKDEESNKCFHFYHEECKKKKHIKACPLCKNGITVRNHFMFLNGYGNDFRLQLKKMHGLEDTEFIQGLGEKKLKKDLLYKINTLKNIPEEVRNKYRKRYEMEKFYGKVIHWSEYEEKEASYPKDKEEKEEAKKEAREKKYAKIAEKRQAVQFCPDCCKGCGICGKKSDSTFHQGVFAHPSCNERYKKNRLCGSCGVKTEIGGSFQGHVCGSCAHTVSSFHCFFCRDKIEID